MAAVVVWRDLAKLLLLLPWVVTATAKCPGLLLLLLLPLLSLWTLLLGVVRLSVVVRSAAPLGKSGCCCCCCYCSCCLVYP